VTSEGPITVRHATPDDAFAIAWVHVASWQVAYRGLIPESYLAALSVERRQAFWRDSLAMPAARTSTFVARAGDRVIGFASMGRSRDEGAASDAGELFAIYVEPACWGAGAGRQLMGRALEGLRLAGFRSATLWVLAENTRAIDFYARSGWTPDGARRTETIDSVEVPEIRLASNL
jgi:ribosomal protein S18 acetylase RimI-like enzyme